MKVWIYHQNIYRYQNNVVGESFILYVCTTVVIQTASHDVRNIQELSSMLDGFYG